MKHETKRPVSYAEHRAMALGEFLKRDFDIDAELLGTMILAKSIGMIAGLRGSGKSWLAMLIAYSVAGGKQLEPWGRGRGECVVIFDGEMRAAGLQDRFRLLHARNSKPNTDVQVERNLHIVSRDCVGDAIGSIDMEEGQENIDAFIPPSACLIIIDNLSAWTSGGREDSNSWAAVKNWLIKKRLQGIAVLLIHHAGKNGQQRGSSAHEDLLDYSILLSPLPSGQEHQETRFLIEHTKLRDHIPKLRKKYECTISSDGDRVMFKVEPQALHISDQDAEILRLRRQGLSYDAIGRKLGINKSTVSRKIRIVSAQRDADLEAAKS